MSHRIRPASRLAGMLLALCAGGALAACADERPTVVETAPDEPAPLAVESPPPAPAPAPSGMPVGDPAQPAQGSTTQVAPGGGGGAETVEAMRAQEQTMINLTGSPTGNPTTTRTASGGGAVPQQGGWMFWVPAPSTSSVTPPATGPGSTVTPTAETPSQLGIGVPSAALPGPGAVNVAPAAGGTTGVVGGIVDDGATLRTTTPTETTGTPPPPGAPVVPTRTVTGNPNTPVVPQAPGAPANFRTAPGQTPPGTTRGSSTAAPGATPSAPGTPAPGATPSAPGTPAPGATPSAPGTSPTSPSGTR
jgi:hypothetical protein